MRKLVYRLMVFLLVLLPCAAFALNTPPFSEFKAVNTYKTDGNIMLHVPENDTDYSFSYYQNVKQFDFESYRFDGKLNRNYNEVPDGSLTVLGGNDSGTRIPLYSVYNGQKSGEFVPYWVPETERDSLLGKRVMWNIPTEIDLLVGSTKLPAKGTSKAIETNATVPYIEPIIIDGAVKAIDLRFIKRGDLREKKTVNPSALVTVTGEYQNIFRNLFDQKVFDNFKAEVKRVSFDFDVPEKAFFDPEGGGAA